MDNYEILSTIGEGTYGVVLKARHKESGQIVAIKRFKESDEDEQVRKTALREVRILKQLKHINIVNLIEVFRRKGRLYLVFEFVERTILQDLEENPNGLPEVEVKKAMYQLIKSIEFCHAHNVIHRDIKPENLLISKSGTLKLCDFGFARTLAGNGARYTDYVSTRWYRSPELLVGDQSYGKPVDMWAVGCMLAEMMTGMPLFPGESDIDQLFHIMRTFGALTPRMLQLVKANPLFVGVTIPDTIEVEAVEQKVPQLGADALDLLKWCLAYEPSDRPSCAELLNHKYFKGFAEWFEPQLKEALDKDAQDFVMFKKRKTRKDRRSVSKVDDDDHPRRGRSRKRRSSPYFDEQAVRDACRREARRESRRESRRDRDPRERDLREVNGKMREDRRREREALKENEVLEAGGKADDVGASGGKEHEREREHREHRRHKSRHMSVDMQSTSLADGVVGVGMAGGTSGVPGAPAGGGEGFQTAKDRQREERRRERERERLRSRDAYRDRERERLDTRDSMRERKARERLTSRERSDRESKERERLHSRDHKRDWDLQLPPSRGMSYQGSQPPLDGRHLPTLATSDTPKASRLVAFPTLASDDAGGGGSDADPMRRPRTRDSFIPQMQIPKIHARDNKSSFGGGMRTLPTVQASFESKVGAMFKPKLSNHHGLSGFKSHSNYFKGSGIGGMGIAGMGGIGMAKPPAHKPLPQFQYGGGFGKPPSRGRTTSSSGIDFKNSNFALRTSTAAPPGSGPGSKFR